MFKTLFLISSLEWRSFM